MSAQNEIKTTKIGRPLTVGIWLCLPGGLHWRGEGIGRTIEWVVLGLKESGVLSKHVSLKIAVTDWMFEEIRQSFHQLLGNLEGIEFVQCASPRYKLVTLVDKIFSLNGYFKPTNLYYHDPVSILEIFEQSSDGKTSQAHVGADGKKFNVTLKALNSLKKNALMLGADRLRNEIAREMGFPPAPPTPIKGGLWPFGERAKKHRDMVRNLKNYQKEYWKKISDKLFQETDKPLLPGVQNFLQILNIVRRIPIVRSVVGFAIRGINTRVNRSEKLGASRYALEIDDVINVDVWWVPTPNIDGPEFLRKPVVANFWDFVIGEFGFLWSDQELSSIYSRVKIVMHKASALLTQSRHNVNTKLINGFMVDPEKITVCYLTAPRSYAQAVPSYKQSGIRSCETRAEAASIISSYLKRRLYLSTKDRINIWRSRGLEIERLLQFPFNKATYFICSTQNRPYKNLAFMVDSFLLMVEKYDLDAYLIMTSPFSLSDKEDVIGKVIKKRARTDRIFVLNRVPNRVHAALYHCAVGTLHPSFTEGGVGSYPFLEGMIMGTPGLVADGEYSREGQRLHPNYSRVIMSPTSRKKAAEKMRWLIENRDEAFSEQLPIFEQHMRWSWEDVGDVYAAEFFRAADYELPDDLRDRIVNATRKPHFQPSEFLESVVRR